MDKRWRNLGIIFVLLVAISIFIFLFNFVGQDVMLQKSDSGSEEVANIAFINLFGVNDFDFDAFAGNDLILFDEDSNLLSLRYSEEDLLFFDAQLDYLLDVQKSELNDESFKKFERLVNLYKMQIDFTLSYYSLLLDFEEKYKEILDLNGESEIDKYCSDNDESNTAFFENFFLVSDKLDLLVDGTNSFYDDYKVVVFPSVDFLEIYEELELIFDVLDNELYNLCGDIDA